MSDVRRNGMLGGRGSCTCNSADIPCTMLDLMDITNYILPHPYIATNTVTRLILVSILIYVQKNSPLPPPIHPTSDTPNPPSHPSPSPTLNPPTYPNPSPPPNPPPHPDSPSTPPHPPPPPRRPQKPPSSKPRPGSYTPPAPPRPPATPPADAAPTARSECSPRRSAPCPAGAPSRWRLGRVLRGCRARWLRACVALWGRRTCRLGTGRGSWRMWSALCLCGGVSWEERRG